MAAYRTEMNARNCVQEIATGPRCMHEIAPRAGGRFRSFISSLHHTRRPRRPARVQLTEVQMYQARPKEDPPRSTQRRRRSSHDKGQQRHIRCLCPGACTACPSCARLLCTCLRVPALAFVCVTLFVLADKLCLRARVLCLRGPRSACTSISSSSGLSPKVLNFWAWAW